MRQELLTLPDVDPRWEACHRVRCLAIDGRSPVLAALADWKKKERADYRKIMKVVERVARLDRVRDEKHVKADSRRTGIHEMRAHRGHARVLFFYDDDGDKTAICVHAYWKGSGDQAKAFEHAAALMDLWKSAH